MTPRLYQGIVVLVTAVWVANLVAGVLPIGYDPDPAINGIFGVIVGGAMVLHRNGHKPNQDKQDSTGDSEGRRSP
jgi:hypothetical protein